MAAPRATTPRQSMAFDRLINAMDLRGLSGTEIAAQLLQTHGITMSPQAVRSRIRKMNAATHQAREDKIAVIVESAGPHLKRVFGKKQRAAKPRI